MEIRPSRMALPLLTACVALSSYAQTPKPPAPPPGLVAERCTTGLCEIKVFVDDCNAPGGIRVDKPLVAVDAAKNMRWEIVTKGFEFERTKGIDFPPPNAQFEVQNSPHANEFRIHNKKAHNGDFYYFVNVKGCRPLDPWIRNQS